MAATREQNAEYLTIRIGRKLKRQLRAQAEQNHRKLSDETRLAIERHLADSEKAAA